MTMMEIRQRRPLRLGEKVLFGPDEVTVAYVDAYRPDWVGVRWPHHPEGDYECMDASRLRRPQAFAGKFRKWGH